MNENAAPSPLSDEPKAGPGVLVWFTSEQEGSGDRRRYSAVSATGVTYAFSGETDVYLTGDREGRRVMDPQRFDTAALARDRAQTHAANFMG